MSIFNKTNGIELTQDDLNDARTTAALFDNELIKKRAFANVIAARSALRLLFSFNIDATNLYSMYSINKVLESLDLADVYVGDIKIDARLVYDENEIFIPKSHFNLGIQPDLYLVLKVEKDLSGVQFLGCINPDEMDKTKENRDYYFVDEDILYNLKIFKNLVKNGKTTKEFISTPEDFERAQNLIVPFEDDDMFNADKEFYLQQLAHNVELRKKNIEFENFEFVSKKVVKEETVYGDSVLGLVGTEKLYDRGEFTTDINLDELSDSTVDDFVESFKEGTPIVEDIEDAVTEEIDIDGALKEFYEDTTEPEIPTISDTSVSTYENVDFEEGFALAQDENSKIELENILNEMTEFDNESDDIELHEENETDDLPALDVSQVETSFDESQGEEDALQVVDIDETSNEEDELSLINENSEVQENIEVLPELDYEDEDEEDEDNFNFDQNAPINFEEDSFALPDVGGFSLDDIGEIKEEDEDIGFVSENDSDFKIQKESVEQEVHENTSENNFEEDDEPDIADLPTLKIFQESPDTYKKKMYKAPVIDDINMEAINLDDFDDYETEDKEKETQENEEFNDMLSGLDDILSSDNLQMDGVDEILTDDELSESLKNIQDEQAQNNIMNENYVEMEVSKNSPTLQQHATATEAGMSLDDFLNSSSFNEMSTNQNISDNIENDGIDNIYQTDGNMANTPNLDQSNPSGSPETLLTDEASMVDDSTNFYGEDPVVATSKAKPKQKSNTPMLLAILIVLLCVFAYTRKDDIMQTFNFGATKEEEVPEFDLNKLREPQPAPTEGNVVENPIPTIPQPTDMPVETQTPAVPDTPMPLNAPANPNNTTAGARPTPQNTSNKISKISWEVSESVASNAKIRKYLQIAGRTLRLSLQNDLLVATELPYSNRVMMDLKIAPSGNLIMSDFVISSGSKQIDSIILKSVKDTLKYVRPPLGEIQSPNSNFTLIINF